MSSIVGAFGKIPEGLIEDGYIRKMSETIRHRGGGIISSFSSIDFNLEVNSLRFSKGNEIQYYEDDVCVIAIDGELTNRNELLQLIDNSDWMNSTVKKDLNDVQIISYLQKTFGGNFINKIDGQYCILLFDKYNKVLHLYRDRWAQKPIYYISFPDYMLFASEIKAFTVLPNWKAKLNLVTARDYLLWSGMRDASNQTLFEEVYQVEGGCYLRITPNCNIEYKRYYKIPDSNSKDDEISADVDTFRNMFFDSINNCMSINANLNEVGTCLSGGIDSTTIASFMVDSLKKKHMNNSVETFTAYFSAPEADEREFIDEAIDKLGLNSNKLSPDFSDFISELDKLLWIQDEPFSSSAIFAQYKVYEAAAKQGILFLCDGQAADEYLCGYRSHQIAYLCDLIRGFHLGQFKKAMKNIKNKYHERVSFIEILKQLGRPLPNFMVYKQAQKKNEEYGFRYLPSFEKLIYEKERNVKAALREYSIMQMRIGWPKLYHHIDRNAMSNTVVNRAPYAPTKMVEYVINLPGKVLMNEGVTKNLLRNAARGYTPDKILDRYSKLGFKTPESYWFENNKEWFSKEYDSALSKMSKLINPDKAKSIKDKDFIFRTICFSHWMDIFGVEI